HPGSSPIRLAPRAPPMVINQATPPSPSPSSTTSRADPPSYVSAGSSGPRLPFFYEDMTASKLKEYLRERGVLYTDILDKETLCRRAWEARCDTMNLHELDAFLTENNISTADCRDTASRRRKAMEAFRMTRPLAPKHVQKDDIVVLVRLNRDEMNG